jgi:Ca2+-dependent lipid-binding protein
MNLYQRLNKVMKEVTTVFKGSEVSMGGNRSYKAVSHDDVTSLIHLPLANAGVFVEISTTDSKITPIETKSEYQGREQIKISYLAEVWVQATFVNVDKPEERFSVKKYAYALDSGDKAIGKAESMAVKYIFLKNLMLESTDEEESREFERTNKLLSKADNANKPAQASVAAQPASAPTSTAPAKTAVAQATASRGSFRKNAAVAASEEL